jgi:uncharacterized Zn-binding protein involved in type VI secretion
MAYQPAAKQGDHVVGVDTHVLMVPSPAGPVPTPTPMPFNGALVADLSADVLVCNLPAATVGSTAVNTPPHVPAAGPFQKPPSNQGKVQQGTKKVLINGKDAARVGDPAMTCNDPADAPNGTIVGSSTVLLGG